MAVYKINMQKLVALLYTNDKYTEKETNETILLTLSTKKKKIPGNKPILKKWKTTEMKILRLWKKLRTILADGKTSHVHGLEKPVL